MKASLGSKTKGEGLIVRWGGEIKKRKVEGELGVEIKNKSKA